MNIVKQSAYVVVIWQVSHSSRQ